MFGIVILTSALFFIGMCLYIGEMVSDMRAALAGMEKTQQKVTAKQIIIGETLFHSDLLAWVNWSWMSVDPQNSNSNCFSMFLAFSHAHCLRSISCVGQSSPLAQWNNEWLPIFPVAGLCRFASSLYVGDGDEQCTWHAFLRLCIWPILVHGINVRVLSVLGIYDTRLERNCWHFLWLCVVSIAIGAAKALHHAHTMCAKRTAFDWLWYYRMLVGCVRIGKSVSFGLQTSL